MAFVTLDSPFVSSHSLYFSPEFISSPIISIDNRTLPLFPFTAPWIFPFFIFCLLGIFITLICFFLFVYLTFYLQHNSTLLVHLFICSNIGWIYFILIICLIRGSEFLCSLREFFFQFSYVLLYSTFLADYFRQWLKTRIALKRTEIHLTVLFYLLLISIQIPIGILWWYFTSPRTCPQENSFDSAVVTLKRSSCAYQCFVDDRFYATLTYVILELSLCTLIAFVAFFSCRSLKNVKDHRQKAMRFFHLLTFILIDLTWIVWSVIYHSTDPFPSLMIGLFTISSICLFLILLPQIYFHFQIKSSRRGKKKVLTNADDRLRQLMHFSNPNNASGELGTSGTFLPISRTPRELCVVNGNKKTTTTTVEKLDQLIYGKPPSPAQQSTYENRSSPFDNYLNPLYNTNKQQLQVHAKAGVLQRQFTSSSIASELVHQRQSTMPSSSSMYHSSYSPAPRRDETIIPILCSSDRYRTSTPVKMRILMKKAPKTNPLTTQRYSKVRSPYHHFFVTPTRTSHYYSPWRSAEQVQHDPHRTILPSRRNYLSPYSQRFEQKNHRLLSERLWDMNSDNDDDDERCVPIGDRRLLTKETRYKFPSDDDDQSIFNDEEEEDDNDEPYEQQRVNF